MADQGIINALFGGPSWLEQANQQRQKDIANYLQGGVPQMMADTQGTQNLAGGFGGTTKNVGIRAYHGSPYDFDKFDLSKIGTGEGAQAYGHGLYFAENPAVAKQYRDALASSGVSVKPGFDYDPTELGILNRAIQQGRSGDDIPALLREQEQNYRARGEVPIADSISSARKNLEAGNYLPLPPGKMYEVNINAKPEQFLNWDKPLNEQPQIAIDPLLETIKKEAYSRALASTNKSRADQLWSMVKDPMTAPVEFAQEILRKPETTQSLSQAGIPGIKYLDQGSRTGGQGTSNYVIFDPSLIDITKKWALIGALMGGGGLASQQAGEPGQ